MSEEPRGIRALPPALVFGIGAWLVMSAVHCVYVAVAEDPYGMVRFSLVKQGIGFASEVLCLLGSLELARRLTGRVARGVQLAAIGLGATIALDVVCTAVNFMDKPWQHEWLFRAFDYGFYLAWLAVPVGAAIACWRERRWLAVLVVVIGLVSIPPPFLRETVSGWLTGRAAQVVGQGIPRVLREVLLLWAFAAIAYGASAADRVRAASGLRTAGRALWLRVIGPLFVVLVTLVVVGGTSGRDGIEMLRLAAMASAIIGTVALAQLGWGSVRACHASVPELGRWPVLLGGAVALWGAGVSMAQLVWLYKLLYRGDSLFASSQVKELTQALSVALPLLVTAGIALLAVAIGGLAARQGNEQLRAQAQAKGAGFVTLTLVALAIQAWMVPKAQRAADAGSYMILLLLAGVSSLAATVMIARLCAHGAEELERGATLPAATVVSGGESPRA